ncbi:MAG: lysophospholipid acyltransferase family protein [Phycisphaerales bacterium]|nr:lysophospholipid acyltransferase family protein [Phycisphaerales bacterium]
MLSILQFRRRNGERSAAAQLIWYGLVAWAVGLTCWVFWRFRTMGRGRIPRRGAALVIANHQSHIDPMLLGIILRDRSPRMMARRSLLTDSPWPMPWVLRVGYRCIFVDRGSSDPSAMRAVLQELRSGRLSVVFPEGTRSLDGTMRPFERGVWLLIKRGGAPVLPVGIEGTFDAWPKGSGPRRRGRILANVGTPIPCEELLEMGVDRALEHLHDRVDALRAEAREVIRRRTGGRWPLRGPADEQTGGNTCTAGR